MRRKTRKWIHFGSNYRLRSSEHRMLLSQYWSAWYRSNICILSLKMFLFFSCSSEILTPTIETLWISKRFPDIWSRSLFSSFSLENLLLNTPKRTESKSRESPRPLCSDSRNFTRWDLEFELWLVQMALLCIVQPIPSRIWDLQQSRHYWNKYRYWKCEDRCFLGVRRGWRYPEPNKTDFSGQQCIPSRNRAYWSLFQTRIDSVETQENCYSSSNMNSCEIWRSSSWKLLSEDL